MGSRVLSSCLFFLEHTECIYYRNAQPTHTLQERERERKTKWRRVREEGERKMGTFFQLVRSHLPCSSLTVRPVGSLLRINEYWQRKVCSPDGEALLSGGDYGIKLHCILTYVMHWNSESIYATQHLGYLLKTFRFKDYVSNMSNDLSNSECEYFIYRRPLKTITIRHFSRNARRSELEFNPNLNPVTEFIPVRLVMKLSCYSVVSTCIPA